MTSRKIHSGHVFLGSKELPPISHLCTPLDIQFDVQYYQALQTKLAQSLNLVAQPQTIGQLTEAIALPNTNLNQVVRIIEQDPVISGMLLNAVRQPVFQKNFKREIDIVDVNQCVALLGLECTYRMTMATAITQLANQDPLSAHLTHHAVKTAYACAEIAGYLPPQGHQLTQQKVYLYGLYMHSGYLVMAKKTPAAIANLFKQGLSLPDTAYEAEQLSQAPTHEQLSVLIAMQWGIDVNNTDNYPFLNAIAAHHHPNYHCISHIETRLLIASGLLAQSMVSEITYQAYQSEEMHQQAQKAAQTIGLSDEALSNIRKNLSSHWMK